MQAELGAVLTVVLFVAGGVREVGAQGTAPRSQGFDNRVIYDFTRGVDPLLYNIVRGEDSDSLDLCRRDAAARREVKERAYEDAFRKIDAMGRTYRKAQPHYVEGFHRLTDKTDPTILREDIRFIRAAEVYDHKRSQYRYTVDLGIRKLPELMPQLDEQLRRFLDQMAPERDGNEIIFDLNRIVGRLEEDSRFREELERLLRDESFKSSARYKDDDTQRFIDAARGSQVQIQGYEPGQYSVNSLIRSIIQRSVAAKIDATLEDYKNVIVVCEGATDALMISGSLQYSGKARVAAVGKRIQPGTQEGVQLSGIRNNIDLSFARGYEGARALAQILGPKWRSGRIQMLYTGMGIVATAGGNQPESRRITFRLTLGPKLR